MKTFSLQLIGIILLNTLSSSFAGINYACTWPFVYNGYVYKYGTCIETADGWDKFIGKYSWCPTQLDKNWRYHDGYSYAWCWWHVGKGTCHYWIPRGGPISAGDCQKPGPTKCILPFVYKNHVYDKCVVSTSKSNRDSGKVSWCPVRVNERQEYVYTPGKELINWKYCEKHDRHQFPCHEYDTQGFDRGDCRKVEPCVFPFVYKGYQYTKCITASSSNRASGRISWCPTKVQGKDNKFVENDDSNVLKTWKWCKKGDDHNHACSKNVPGFCTKVEK